MGRTINKLTVKSIVSLKKPGYYSDGGNLYLQVSKSITKSWIFKYVMDGKKREIGLGSLSNVTLAEARNTAEGYRKLISRGINPLDEKIEQQKCRSLKQVKSMTFSQCAEAYIDAHKVTWKNPKHIQQWQNTLNQYVFPIIGEIDINLIDTDLMMQCLENIWATKNETATRIRGRCESIIDWATVHGYREGDNPARWRGHLDKLLAKPSKIQNTTHHPALPFTEISIFMQKLQLQEGVAAKALELTILTATRTSEVINATWDEIDLENGLWIIPMQRMKAGRQHRVPLCLKAMKILTEMSKIRTNNYIFSGGKKGLSNMAMSKLLKRMDYKHITVHGFRSTFRDWASECASYPNETVEMALAHTIKNAVEAAYRLGDLFEKRKQLMDDWADYCINPR